MMPKTDRPYLPPLEAWDYAGVAKVAVLRGKP